MTKWAQEKINAGARVCVQCCSCTHGRSARAPHVVQAYGQCHEPRYEFNVLKGDLVKEKAIVLKQVSLPGLGYGYMYAFALVLCVFRALVGVTRVAEQLLDAMFGVFFGLKVYNKVGCVAGAWTSWVQERKGRTRKTLSVLSCTVTSRACYRG